MITVGIIIAITSEYKAVKKILKQITLFHFKKEFSINTYKLLTGNYKNHQLVIIKTGVGYDKAEQATCFLLKNYNLNIVLNLGIAGAINSVLSIGSLFLCNSTIYEKKPTEIVQIGNDYFTWIRKICKKIEKNFFEGRIITVKKALADNKRRNYFRSNYNADAVDMELYAIAKVLNNKQIPFFSIKAISDMADSSIKLVDVLFFADGKIHTSQLIKQILINPFKIFSLTIRFFLNSKKALKTLQKFINLFLIEVNAIQKINRNK